MWHVIITAHMLLKPVRLKHNECCKCIQKPAQHGCVLSMHLEDATTSSTEVQGMKV